MALTASLFTQPLGDLTPALFPLTAEEAAEGTYADAEAKLEAFLAAWIAQAEALTADEDAQAAHVRVRAYTTVADRFASEARSAAVSGVSVSYDLALAERVWRAKAVAAQADLDAALDTDPAPPSVVLARTPVWA